MGTSGNLAWAEGVGASVSQPAEALKATGYGLNEIPTSEEFNWLLQQLGQSVVRRFDTTRDMISARRAGALGVASFEDFGFVRPYSAATRPKYTQIFSAALDVSEVNLAADGEWIWTTVLSGGEFFIRRRDREQTSTFTDQPAGTFVYPLIATAGGNVYTVDDNAGVPSLQAYNRSTLALSYQIALPAAATARAIATNGSYVVVAAGNFLRIYIDNGASLTLHGSYDHGAQINCVAISREYAVIGGASPGGGPPHNQIRVVVLQGVAALTSLSRAGNPAVTSIAYDDHAIVFSGDIDTTDYTGHFRSKYSALRLTEAVATAKVLLHDGNLGMAQGSTLTWYEPEQGEVIETKSLSGTIYALTHDNERIWAICDNGAANRIYCFSTSDSVQLFTVIPAFDDGTITLGTTSAVQSLLRPVR